MSFVSLDNRVIYAHFWSNKYAFLRVQLALDCTVSRNLAFSVQRALYCNTRRLVLTYDRTYSEAYRDEGSNIRAEHDADVALSSAITCYTCSLLAGLSYGARKHADTDAITAGQRKVIPSVHFTSVALGVHLSPGPLEYRVKSLLRQLRIRVSPVPPSGGFTARCPPGCYFGSSETDFHFNGFLRISMGTCCTWRKLAVQGNPGSRYLGQKDPKYTGAIYHVPSISYKSLLALYRNESEIKK